MSRPVANFDERLRAAMLAVPRGEPALQDQLLKKGARIEMLRRRQIFKGTRQFPARDFFCGGSFIHKVTETTTGFAV